MDEDLNSAVYHKNDKHSFPNQYENEKDSELISISSETSIPDNLPSKEIISWEDIISFFVFGLANNVVYIVFLSAAADLLYKDRSLPKSLVILINILPCTVVKLFCPYVLPKLSYRSKALITVITAIVALQIVAWIPSIYYKLLGIGLASAGSGFGESAFLSLISFYTKYEISSWSTGTGSAGIIGSLLYFVLSTLFNVPLSYSIFIMTIFPVLMLCCFLFVLKVPPSAQLVEVSLSSSEDSEAASVKGAKDLEVSEEPSSEQVPFTTLIQSVQPLLVPYILPLFIVYFMEYVNMSIMYTILFPLPGTPFKSYEEEFRTYNLMYQIGVFISRSSLSLLSIRRTWILALLQSFNMLLFLHDSLYHYIPNIYIALCLLIWVGLLGGSAYVNTFANIKNDDRFKNRSSAFLEFTMATTSVTDSIGITLAALISLLIEPALCQLDEMCRSYNSF